MIKTKNKKQRNPKLHKPAVLKNRVIIVWINELVNDRKRLTEKFKNIPSEDAAKKLISKRRIENMISAIWYNDAGQMMDLLSKKSE